MSLLTASRKLEWDKVQLRGNAALLQIAGGASDDAGTSVVVAVNDKGPWDNCSDEPCGGPKNMTHGGTKER